MKWFLHFTKETKQGFSLEWTQWPWAVCVSSFSFYCDSSNDVCKAFFFFILNLSLQRCHSSSMGPGQCDHHGDITKAWSWHTGHMWRERITIQVHFFNNKKDFFLCVYVCSFSLLQSVSVYYASAQQQKHCLRGEQARSNETRELFSDNGRQSVYEAGVSLSPEIIVLCVHQEWKEHMMHDLSSKILNFSV